MRTPRIKRIENPDQYVGQSFNNIKIIGICKVLENERELSCRCLCHCGREFSAPLWRLISNVQKSCGTCGSTPSMRSIKIRNDLSGYIFGNLAVLRPSGRNTQGRITYECRCSCGRHTIVASNNLTCGNTKSCGRCNYARDTTLNAIRIYDTPEKAHLADCTYGDMKRRCYDPKFPEYKRYGAKGITICKEWLDSPKAYVDWCIAN